MDPKVVLKDPDACPSVAWAALKKMLGDGVMNWEPDTIRAELKRRGIEPTPDRMAKLLGAQTIVTTFEWTTDHNVLFAFALACDGVPSSAEAFLHPTPEQLAWTMKEITALTSFTPGDDEGFDPDTVDPAIAAVLHDDGWVVAPEELSFCQESLDQFSNDEEKLAKEVRSTWESLQGSTLEAICKKVDAFPEDATGVQIKRLTDLRAYVAERETQRAQHHAALSR
jgi:hypothetical protein